MALVQPFIAATRFGLGPRPGELKHIAGDPRGWLHAQLERPQLAPELASLPSPREQVERYFSLRAEKQMERKSELASMRQTDRADAVDAAKSVFATLAGPTREIYLSETKARIDAALHTDTPLYERLVAFWSNHFTVSVQRPIIAGIAGAFEREAIRPHVLGRFDQLLLAVMQHPAMLVYLDNARSVGPNSFAAQRRTELGLNENLGRELLELHTLGVDGGYSQADVVAMAKMLTGWSIMPPNKPGGGPFRFAPRIHEPGSKLLLGVRYEEDGMGEAERALVWLARHPATARHVATQLAIHFIADEPPPTAVARIAAIFMKSDGDLKTVTQAVIDSPEAWHDPLAKVKQPQDFVVSALRATAIDPPEIKPVVQSLRLLGQTPFAAPSPAGWPDTAKDWLGPEALVHRIEWARAFADKLEGKIAPAQLVETTIAPVASQATLAAIAAAPDAAEAITLIFASREFQRR